MDRIGSSSVNGRRRRMRRDEFAPPTPYRRRNPLQYYENPVYDSPPPAEPPAEMPAPLPPPLEPMNIVTAGSYFHPNMATLGLEPDDENPGRFLLVFSFEAAVALSITVIFFAKEADFNLTTTKESLFQPVTLHFEAGLGKFRQPSGAGIDFSMFEEEEILKESGMDLYPLAVKAEVSLVNQNGSEGKPTPGTINTHVIYAVFEKVKGEHLVSVVKQMLWENGLKFDLIVPYGTGNFVEGDSDEEYPENRCVTCYDKPSDTLIMPCGHMYFCGDCAKRFKETKRCPVCRQEFYVLWQIEYTAAPGGCPDCCFTQVLTPI